MKQQRQDLQEWAKATLNAKLMELEAAKRFIFRNQKSQVFFDFDTKENCQSEKTQGAMSIDVNWKGEPTLFVNWDEVNVFDDQQGFFESTFEGDFSSDKMIEITGVKL